MSVPKPIVLLDVIRQIDDLLPAQRSWGNTPDRKPARAAHKYDGNDLAWKVEGIKSAAKYCLAQANVYALLDPWVIINRVNNLHPDTGGTSVMGFAELILDIADVADMRDVPWLFPWGAAQAIVQSQNNMPTYLGIPFATRVAEVMGDILHTVMLVGGRSINICQIPAGNVVLSSTTAQAEAVRYLHNLDHWHPAQRGGNMPYEYGASHQRHSWPSESTPWNSGTGWRDNVQALRVVGVYRDDYRSYTRQHDRVCFIDTAQVGGNLSSHIRTEAQTIKTAYEKLVIRK